MPGPSFTQVFGGSVIYPAQPTFLSIALSANIVLSWPLEIAPSGVPIVADIIEVTASAPGLSITLSDATQTSQGYTALFNNVGVNAFTVLDAGGNVLMSVPSGQAWQIYLADNSTTNGVFRVFQYGAGVSLANAAALAGAGLKAITTTLNENIVVTPHPTNYVSTAADRATCIEWTGGTGTITLPNAATATSGWFVIIKNNGTGIVTVSPPSGLIDGSPSLAFAVDNSAFLVTDGVNYFSLGFGQTINSVFDFISIDLSGDSGNVVLAGAQLNRVSYRFTGALAGNVNIIVPNAIQQYWVDNETSGAFSLTVKTLAGTGVAITQGNRNILYCDGTNVTAAVTFGSSGFSDGTAASPSITFTSDLTLGFYRAGPGILGFSTAGVSRGTINAAGVWNLLGDVNITENVNNAIGFTATNLSAGAGAITLLDLDNNLAHDLTLGISGSGFVGQWPGFTTGPLGEQARIYVNAAIPLSFGTNATIWGTLGAAGNWVFNTPSSGVTAVLNGISGGDILRLLDGTITSSYQTSGANAYFGTTSNHTLNLTTNNLSRLSIANDGSSLKGWGPVAGVVVDMTPDTSTFTATLTGMTLATTGTIRWTRTGNEITLRSSGGINGTSNTTAMTLTGLPVAVRPQGSCSVPCQLLDNSNEVIGTAVFVGGGLDGITFGPAKVSGAFNVYSPNGFTAAGTKGLGSGFTITYTLT